MKLNAFVTHSREDSFFIITLLGIDLVFRSNFSNASNFHFIHVVPSLVNLIIFLLCLSI
jgi:hypothetical protein